MTEKKDNRSLIIGIIIASVIVFVILFGGAVLVIGAGLFVYNTNTPVELKNATIREPIKPELEIKKLDQEDGLENTK